MHSKQCYNGQWSASALDTVLQWSVVFECTRNSATMVSGLRVHSTWDLSKTNSLHMKLINFSKEKLIQISEEVGNSVLLRWNCLKVNIQGWSHVFRFKMNIQGWSLVFCLKMNIQGWSLVFCLKMNIQGWSLVFCLKMNIQGWSLVFCLKMNIQGWSLVFCLKMNIQGWSLVFRLKRV